MVKQRTVDECRAERVGVRNHNKQGSWYTVTRYDSARNVEVTFDDGYVTYVQWNRIGLGTISNPNDVTVCGVGYFGEGPYKSKNNNKTERSYNTWVGMIKRVYSTRRRKQDLVYEGCSVVDEWHNYQEFAKWYEENIYAVSDELMSLDKDILVKGNRIYGPDTCVFTPQRINSLIIKVDKSRGINKIGVFYRESTGRYHATVHIQHKSKFLGSFDTEEQAFEVYKVAKESYIKEVAEEYRDKIPSKLYSALLEYKIEKDD